MGDFESGKSGGPPPFRFCPALNFEEVAHCLVEPRDAIIESPTHLCGPIEREKPHRTA